MPNSRLRLDWGLKTQPERLDFISQYLSNLYFAPTPEELEMMGRYILWGENPSTGLNGRQEGLELPTRFKTWDGDENFESLEALIESPTFSEQIFRKPTDPIVRIPKLKFSRETARKNAPPDVLARFEELWIQIDTTELLCAQYDLLHGKRKTPVRASLLSRFSTIEIEALRAKARSLSIYAYLKKRHELVELRREQYTLRDSYSPPIVTQPTWDAYDAPDLLWGEDIEVRPVNLLALSRETRERLLRQDRYPSPLDFTDKELREIIGAIFTPFTSKRVFDFSSISDLEKFASLYFELEDFRDENPSSTISILFQYWDTYVALAPLKDFQRRILDLKLQRKSNSEIKAQLELEFNKTYTLNYISTLYRQTILKAISETAQYHRTVLESIGMRDQFKTCIDCGQTLLRDTTNFMKKSKVLDGFSPRCKRCEKILREKRKKKEAEMLVKVARTPNANEVI